MGTNGRGLAREKLTNILNLRFDASVC